MIPDRLLLTPEGRSALLSAEAGGLKIRPASFRVGNYSGVAPADTPTDILGDVLHEDTLFLCEILSGNTARFTIEIPTTENTISITEASVKLDSGETLGYVRTSVPYDKASNRKIRLSFMLHLDEDIAHVIDVTLSTFGSVPSVISVDNLPAPSTAIANTLLVLDLQKNGQDDYSPELAYRFGAGGSVWGFGGCTRLFSGNVNFTDGANFEQADVINDFELENEDEVICYISSGKGAGETRRFKIAADKFTAVNSGFIDADSGSVVHIWRQVGGSAGSAGLGLPDRSGTGPDWVLVAGEQNSLPYWSPPTAGGANRTRGNIYNPPGKLKVIPISMLPTTSEKTFVLYNEDPLASGDEESWIHRYSYRKNSAYSMIAVGNVNQLHTSYDLYNNILEFPENVPVEAIIDARLFELEPHTGSRVEFKSNTHVGDNLNREFDLPALPEDSTKVFVYVERICFSPATYSIDFARRKLVFLEPPKLGLKIEINVMTHVDTLGFATLMHVMQVRVNDNRRVFILPFAPSSKENVLINLNGLHIFKDEYALVGNKIVTNVDINVEAGDLDLEFIIFENVRSEGTVDSALRGIVLDAFLDKDGINLVRSGANNIRLPMPKVNLTTSNGIKVEGDFPNFHLSLPSVESRAAKFGAISKTESADQTTELSSTFRIEFNSDIIVKIDAYFEAQLGPGFKSDAGTEEMQFGVGFKTLKSNPPELGRNLKGTGISGFGRSTENATGVIAYSNGTVGDTVVLKAENNPQGYIDIVATLKVVNSKIGDYNSKVRITLSGMVVPIN